MHRASAPIWTIRHNVTEENPTNYMCTTVDRSLDFARKQRKSQPNRNILTFPACATCRPEARRMSTATTTMVRLHSVSVFPQFRAPFPFWFRRSVLVSSVSICRLLLISSVLFGFARLRVFRVPSQPQRRLPFTLIYNAGLRFSRQTLIAFQSERERSLCAFHDLKSAVRVEATFRTLYQYFSRSEFHQM